jgi:hypothetical protein
MSAIDTRIDGSVASIQGTVDWLRGSLGTAVTDTASGTVSAIADSGWDWIGDAGDAFRDELSDSVDFADQITDGVGKVADGFENYGEVLGSAQRKMAEVRAKAANAGLELTDDLILPPGPMPDFSDLFGTGVTVVQGAIDAVEAYRRGVQAFQEALADTDLIRTSLYNGLRDLMAVEQGLEDIVTRIKSIDWSKVKDSKLVHLLRQGSKIIKPVDWGLTIAEMGAAYCDGQPPGEILIRALGEEGGFWVELATNHPRIAEYLEKIDDEDHDYEELGGDAAVDVYRQLPDDLRAVIDAELERRYFGTLDPVCAAADEIEDSGLPIDRDTLKNALSDVVGGALDGVDDVKDFGENRIEDTVENLDRLKDTGLAGLEAAGDRIDDLGELVKPSFPW